ncbi:uncharacterized protein LOC124267137 [Haliotis rubra]|uniref:uncharacterized protein LOC124267137 n=1 Tax=Haliotis rubra TaxID=36100 RepID=UPI001EE59514|nr:uncharacterized protein LOC124267137 [Haliotis rubra]
MALPFIPALEIRQTFEELTETVTPRNKLCQLVGYMKTQWIYKRTCPPSSLSCFRQTTRTNNHIEVREQQLGLYRLIKALHREASLLPIKILLLKESKLRGRTRDRSTTAQKEIFPLWAEFKEDQITVQQLLSKVSRIHGPARHTDES